MCEPAVVGTPSPEWGERVTAYVVAARPLGVAELKAFLAERLAAAQERGELPKNPPAPDLTRILMTAIFGFLVVENEPVASRRSDAHQLLDLLVGERRSQARKSRRKA